MKTCKACNRQIKNAVYWNSEPYGKGCFKMHILPIIKKEELNKKESFKKAYNIFISILQNLEIEYDSEYQKKLHTSIVRQIREKQWITTKQIHTLYSMYTIQQKTRILITLENYNVFYLSQSIYWYALQESIQHKPHRAIMNIADDERKLQLKNRRDKKQERLQTKRLAENFIINRIKENDDVLNKYFSHHENDKEILEVIQYGNSDIDICLDTYY